jgi:hypothetical protein
MTGIEDKSPRPMAAVENMFVVWVWVGLFWDYVKACMLAEITGVTGQVMVDWTGELDEAFICSEAADIGGYLQSSPRFKSSAQDQGL